MSASKDPKAGKKISSKNRLDEILDFGPPDSNAKTPNERIQRLMTKLKEISQRIDNLSQDA